MGGCADILEKELQDDQKRDAGDAEHAGDKAVEEAHGQRKIKKAAYEIGDNKKQKTGNGVYENFEHELHGSGEQLYDNDDRQHQRDGRKDKRGGFHIYTMTLSVPFFV